MQLFIRTSDVCMEIPNIKLLSGWLPSVGEQEASHEQLPGPHIEPAVWFKVLVLDSVSIDCVRRAVMWNCDSALPSLKDIIKEADSFSTSSIDSEQRKRISESMYIGGEFYGFESDLDELFNTMQCMLKEYEAGDISLAYFNEQLLRLLHCYVLPAVSLTVEDLPQVESVLFEQEDNIRTIDLMILQKNTQAEEIHHALVRQLDRHVVGLSTLDVDSNEVYPLEFSQMLHSDVEKELLSSADKLDYCQEEVERAKASVTKDGKPTRIKEKRDARDQCYEHHKNLLMAREVLRDMIQACTGRKMSISEAIKTSFKSGRPAICTIDPLHNIYMELHRKLQEVKGEAQSLMDKKVLMMSVKEAIRATVCDLQEGGSSLGLDQHRSGLQRATDVLQQSTIPRDWLNLAEQVAGLLANSDHEITCQHRKFCLDVIDNCQAALFEKHLFEMTSGTSPRDIPRSWPEGAASVGSNNSLTVTLVEQDNTRRGSKPIVLTVADDGACGSSPDKLSVHSEDRVSLIGVDLDEASCTRPDSLIQLEGQLGDEDIVILHDTDKNHLKSAIEKLKRDIRKHFEDMTLKIQQELGHHTNSAYKNIWLRYESHFFDSTMSHIMELYTAAYAHICGRLCQSIAHLTAADFDLEESLISTMLEDFSQSLNNEGSEQTSSQPLDTVDNHNSAADIVITGLSGNPCDNNNGKCESDCGLLLVSSPEPMSSCQSTAEECTQCANHTITSLAHLPQTTRHTEPQCLAVTSCDNAVEHRSVSTDNNNEHRSVSTDMGNEHRSVSTDMGNEHRSVSTDMCNEHRSVSTDMGNGQRYNQDGAVNKGYHPISDVLFSASDVLIAKEPRSSSAVVDNQLDNEPRSVCVVDSELDNEPNGPRSESVVVDIELDDEPNEPRSESTVVDNQLDNEPRSKCAVVDNELDGSVVYLEDVSSNEAGPTGSHIENQSSMTVTSDQHIDLVTVCPVQSDTAAQRMKKITVHYPSSVTVIYNRRTWPLPQQYALPPDVEYGLDALSLEKDTKASSPAEGDTLQYEHAHTVTSGQPKLLCLRPEFRQRFELAMTCIHKAITDTIPLNKMQHLTGCLREINKQVSDFQAEALHTWLGACSDDLIDMLVILLCNCELKDTMRLYSHLMLLTDLIPPFFEGGPYSFALVQFSVAYQFIQERLLIKNRVCQPDITTVNYQAR